jgi:UDP-glucose 4-epimerase
VTEHDSTNYEHAARARVAQRPGVGLSLHALVTGGAGFIGSTLVDRLLADGHTVTALDNFSTGRRAFLRSALCQQAFRLIEGDLLDDQALRVAMTDQDIVFHLAANADVRFGLTKPQRDLEQNTIGTFHVLEAMRAARVNRLVFASTGSIYGEPDVFPTPETCPFPVQTSLYGASKLAAEGLISAYSTGFGIQALVFRFVSILGERYTHGHVYDFYRKLTQDPSTIEVLGNGQQRKSYLYVQDCIDGMLCAVQSEPSRFSIFNLGTDEYCTVDRSLDWICETLSVNPRREYTGGDRGWVGDSPFIYLDCTRIRSIGWAPTLSIREGVVRTLNFLREQEHQIGSQ